MTRRSSDTTAPTVGADGLEVLERAHCMELLANHRVGRVAVEVADDSPLVVPVNYLLDGEAIVFRTDMGAKVRALRQGPVSFQIDEIDPYHQTGWSVLVRGVAYEATGAEVAHLLVEPWAPGDKERWIRIVPATVTGRRIRLTGSPVDDRGYR
ncbi:MAG TPA: pyridoxamine 5'-phosphate oxidase family protein [Acidimicrobiales bacterium]|nr:pyridoxamine 5'-phosphate oxidase family protein [Acidimicrobiales bacterium]